MAWPGVVQWQVLACLGGRRAQFAGTWAETVPDHGENWRRGERSPEAAPGRVCDTGHGPGRQPEQRLEVCCPAGWQLGVNCAAA